MAENELQKLIKGIFSRIKEEYGYTDEQALIYLKGYEGCAKDNQEAIEKRNKMLRDTVAELCEAKRLLEMAVKDMNRHNICYGIRPCNVCTENQKRPCDTFKWRYTDEALKLIGGETDEKP